MVDTGVNSDMAHLARFRTGWQNETLAQYILSKFAFVARPVSIADDVGTDFFCTLFRKAESDALLPITGFTIQVKSHRDVKSKRHKLDITNKVPYLKDLELPFFFGVVDNSKLALCIYSGELIPPFFSFRGSPKKLTAVLGDRKSYEHHRTPKDEYELDFPKVGELSVSTSESALDEFVASFTDLCLLMRRNLSARNNREYVFETPEPNGDLRLRVYAGPDSAKTIRGSFIKRLAEVFFNLKQQLVQSPASFSMQEFQAYERLYIELKEVGYNPHLLVEQIYDDLRHEVDRVKSHNTT